MKDIEKYIYDILIFNKTIFVVCIMIILYPQTLHITTKLLSIINRIAFVIVKITEDQTFKVNVMV